MWVVIVGKVGFKSREYNNINCEQKYSPLRVDAYIAMPPPGKPSTPVCVLYRDQLLVVILNSAMRVAINQQNDD